MAATSTPRVVGFETLQRLGAIKGSSDHCPLWCQFSRAEPDTDIFQIQDDLTRETKAVQLGKHPVCDMVLDSTRQPCLLDTGSAWTILNPAVDTTEDSDPVFSKFVILGPLSLTIRGSRGAMAATRRVECAIGRDEAHRVRGGPSQ